MNADELVRLTTGLLPIIAALLSIGGAYAVTNWRLKELDRKVEMNTASDEIRRKELVDLRLHIADNYVTTAALEKIDTKITGLENKLDSVKDTLLAAFSSGSVSKRR